MDNFLFLLYYFYCRAQLIDIKKNKNDPGNISVHRHHCTKFWHNKIRKQQPHPCTTTNPGYTYDYLNFHLYT